MPTAQFEAKYKELFKFSKYLKETHDEAWKSMNYERWFRLELRDRVAALEIRDFAKLVNKVRIIEETLKACKARNVQNFEKRGFHEIFRGKGGWGNKKWNSWIHQIKQTRSLVIKPPTNLPTTMWKESWRLTL